MAKKHRNLPIFSTQAISRFHAKVDKTPGLGPEGTCWEWKGKCSRYGHFTVRLGFKQPPTTFLAHRVAYYLFYGSDPIGLEVCHRCDNPSCVNPAHLFLGTRRDNHNDSVAKGRRPRPEQLAGTCGLTGEQVRAIRIERKEQGTLMRELGKKHGVSQTAIVNLLSGKTYRWII